MVNLILGYCCLKSFRSLFTDTFKEDILQSLFFMTAILMHCCPSDSIVPSFLCETVLILAKSSSLYIELSMRNLMFFRSLIDDIFEMNLTVYL